MVVRSLDVAPVYACRSGWRLAVQPVGLPSRPSEAQPVALPRAVPKEAAPPRSLWERVKAWLDEDILFTARTPY
jgi:hypothetical protein